jgi:hypothetical protein
MSLPSTKMLAPGGELVTGTACRLPFMTVAHPWHAKANESTIIKEARDPSIAFNKPPFPCILGQRYNSVKIKNGPSTGQKSQRHAGHGLRLGEERIRYADRRYRATRAARRAL